MVWPLVIAAASAAALGYDYLKETTKAPTVVIEQGTIKEDKSKSTILMLHIAGGLAIAFVYWKFFRKRGR